LADRFPNCGNRAKISSRQPNQRKAGARWSPDKSSEVRMPVYDYLCNDCHKTFEKVLTLSEHDKQPVNCPGCGSKNVQQELSPFFAVTSKKS
jgi:putative FmdB family regulatory protein